MKVIVGAYQGADIIRSQSSNVKDATEIKEDNREKRQEPNRDIEALQMQEMRRAY